MLREVLLLAQVVVLAAAFPLAVISAWGYRDAPFGEALKPLPVVALAFVVEGGLTMLTTTHQPLGTVRLVVSSVGLFAIAWAAIQFAALLTERRQI